MYVEYNSNPENKLVGDCVIRAISEVTDQDWEKTYIGMIMDIADILPLIK